MPHVRQVEAVTCVSCRMFSKCKELLSELEQNSKLQSKVMKKKKKQIQREGVPFPAQIMRKKNHIEKGQTWAGLWMKNQI